ncbi:MAG: diguanylate cyclase [Acutalibacteraceae bacterium]|nr:diguanylate cyclase [Acutalibacteraceae bacterium]
MNVSIGIAQYDEKTDKSMEDTLARADEKMYENKRRRKAHQNITQERT